jgi:hypothetical protein
VLLCYYENDTLKWTNPDYNKCYIAHSPSTNIQELNTNTIRYFPNPVTTSFIVEIDNAETIIVEIYSVTGIKMFSKTIVQREHIDVADYSNGVYFVKFINNNEVVRYGKIIKQ